MIIQVEFWHWWVLALCFIVIEAMIPSGVFAGMTLAGAALGALMFSNPHLPITVQLGIFGTITMVVAYSIAYFRRKKNMAAAVEGQVSADEMMGKEFELKFPIQNGFGDIELDGQHWSIKGPDAIAGTLVRVVKLDGEMLLVYPVNLLNNPEDTQHLR